MAGFLKGILKGADEVASGVDDVASGSDDATKGADDFVSSDDSAQAFTREAADGTNSGGGYVSFDEDSYLKRLGADVAGRGAEQPARMVDAGTSNVATASKWLGGGAVGATGLWAGSQVSDDFSKMRSAESKEAAYEEYIARVKEIQNNENLSPEEKQEMLAALEEAYKAAIENPDNGEKGTLGKVFDDLFGGMGMMDKLLVGIAFIVLVKLAQEAV